MAVNLSPMLFASPTLIDGFASTVESCGASPQQIEFEITENLPLAGNGSARESIAALRDSGFRIALDHYGIGYSGLKRLNYIGVDKLKIDQSFIRELDQASSMQPFKVVEEMIDLGQGMNLTVTAEGVETEAQRDFLSWAGCDALQAISLPARCLSISLRHSFRARPVSPSRHERYVDHSYRERRGGRGRLSAFLSAPDAELGVGA